MSRPAAALLFAALLALGCGDDPTGPDRTELLTGTLRYGQSVQHNFHVNHLGNLRVTLIELRPVFIDVTGLNPANLGISMGLGSPGADGTCNVTAFQALILDRTISLGLDTGNYCALLSDSGNLPEDGTVAYTIELEITE